jgi:hypothetical protein
LGLLILFGPSRIRRALDLASTEDPEAEAGPADAGAAVSRLGPETVALVNDPDLTLDQYTERWLQTAAHELEAKTRGTAAASPSGCSREPTGPS